MNSKDSNRQRLVSNCVRLFLVSLVLGFISSVAWSQKPEPGQAQWPGITATIYTITRLPNNRVAVTFLYQAAPTAPEFTFIADRMVKNFDPNIDQETGENYNPFEPFSIEKGGRLIDESTGTAWPAASLKEGDKVDPGGAEVLAVLGPRETFFVGGVFQCPPLNEDKPPKQQKVSFELPGLVKPIKGVLVPREENVMKNFFPTPQVLARPVVKP